MSEEAGPRRRAPWLFVGVALAWLVAYPCNWWSVVPAGVIGATAATVVARKIWKAREEVFAAPAMILVVFGVSGLGAFGLWAVVFVLRCLRLGSID